MSGEPRPGARAPLAVALALFVGGCALSPAFGGFYSLSAWAPIGLGLLVVALALVFSGLEVPRGLGLLAVGSVGGLWAWSELSRTWALAPAAAQVESPRWLLFAAALFVLLMLLRSAEDAQFLLVACGLAVLAFGCYLEVRMLLGHGADLFLGTRLNGPLGYVNGEAGLLLLGIWPLLAVAERRSRIFAPLALAGATLLGSLLVFAQSRGSVIAVIAVIAVLMVVVPGRVPRAWAIAVVIANLAWAWTGLTSFVHLQSLVGQDGAVRHAALMGLLASLAAGAIWTLVCVLLPSVAPAPARRGLRRAAAVIPALVLLIVVVATGPRAVHLVRTQYSEFVHLTQSPRGVRFLSGGGNRYDYWRVAWREFEAHPLDGVGAGNYPRDYFRLRGTSEDIRQPHSIEMQTIAELGAVGGVLLLLFVLATLTGFFKRTREARGDSRSLLIAVAGGGVFVAWFVDTSGDWLQLLPGVTGIGLVGAATLLAPWRGLADHSSTSQDQAAVDGEASTTKTHRTRVPLRAAGLALPIAIVAFGAIELGRAALAMHYRAQAQAQIQGDPVAAIRRSNDSLRLDADQLDTLYVKAAAFARLDDFRDARLVLRQALRSDHGDSVTWTLLGDIELRAGHRRAAHRAYLSAAKLNPRDLTVAASVRATTGRG